MYSEQIQMNTKKCSNCNQNKELNQFYFNARSKDKFDFRCKECRRADARSYRARNLEKCRQKAKVWRANNPEKVSEYNKNYLPKYRLENKEALTKKQTAYTTNRRRADPEARLASNLRRRLNHALKGNNKSAKTEELIGCTFESLMKHLESKFSEGMTWENYGKVWHVDHIKPLSKFKLTKDKELREAASYLNLQPLFASENLKKSNKYLK